MRAKMIKRLENYWRLEAVNAVLLPAAGLMAIKASGDAPSWPVLLAMGACALLLVVGALAWRMELAVVKGEPSVEARFMPFVALAQPLALSLVPASLGAAVFEVIRDGAWTPSAIAAAGFAAASALEYVNYYVVQLQHFDHLADFSRLVRGRGFRQPHLAKALKRWRRRRD